MNNQCAQLNVLSDKYVVPLAEEPSNIMHLRRFHQELINSLDILRQNTDSFFIAFSYRNYIEDILRNCVEDDILRNDSLAPFLSPLVSSWFTVVKDLNNGVRPKSNLSWFDQLDEFLEEYRWIPAFRRSPPHIELFNVKFMAAPSGWQIPGLPVPVDRDDPTYRVFPDLDATLGDPRTSDAVTTWYANTLRRMIDEANKAQPDDVMLCFVEKSYSVIGATSLIGLLTSQLKVPAIIYRAGHGADQAEITGATMDGRKRAIIIYDVCLSGTVLRNVTLSLQLEFGITVRGSVVLYNFGPEGRRVVTEASPEADFESYLDRTDIPPIELMARLNSLPQPNDLTAFSMPVSRRREEVRGVMSIEREHGDEPSRESDGFLSGTSIGQRMRDSLAAIVTQLDEDAARRNEAARDWAASLPPAEEFRSRVWKQFGPLVEQVSLGGKGGQADDESEQTES